MATSSWFLIGPVILGRLNVEFYSSQVRKIVQGSASQFQVLYEGVIQKYAANDVLQLPPVHASNLHGRIIQVGLKL